MYLRGDFYPRSPCGERPVAAHVGRKKLKFLSTLSLRRATCFIVFLHFATLFLSTLSLRRATGAKIHDPGQILFLSTLSLRRATDCKQAAGCEVVDFYPRSPCGERRRYRVYHGRIHRQHFYPRSPCGERPPPFCGRNYVKNDFYPRSPCGERQAHIFAHRLDGTISIHALLAESDMPMTERIVAGFEFLSTLSLRRATPPACTDMINVPHFYPRSPCGERRVSKIQSRLRL